MNIRINKQQETTILQTIKTLRKREYEKNVDRDAEFVKFIKGIYRNSRSKLVPIYTGASHNLLSSCADEVQRFQGVNKKAKRDDDSNLLKSICFDLDEGKSWADQRRARWIVPLCVGWLDALTKEVAQLRTELELSESFLIDSVVKLLTASYHPAARQATTTNLICTQTMNHKNFRKRLTEVAGIELPRPKEMISPWLNRVREHGLEVIDPASSTSFSSTSSVQDDSVRRELESRNFILQQQLQLTRQMLFECQEELRQCQQERDLYLSHLQQRPDRFGDECHESQPMSMPAAMPVQSQFFPAPNSNANHFNNLYAFPESAPQASQPCDWHNFGMI